MWQHTTEGRTTGQPLLSLRAKEMHDSEDKIPRSREMLLSDEGSGEVFGVINLKVNVKNKSNFDAWCGRRRATIASNGQKTRRNYFNHLFRVQHTAW